MTKIMTDIDYALNDPKFNEAFWEWFDSLPKTMRDKFNSYPSDMAKLNYYNSVWRKRLTSD